MKIKLGVLILLAFFIVGCYSSKEDVYVEDLDLVVVDYDADFDFEPLQTYFMPDSISRVQEDGFLGLVIIDNKVEA